MSKIKINLASGTTVEKSLVTCFKGTSGDYIVFDNETNGPMGYPVICISKFTGTGCEKIFDAAEWDAVKNHLKTIIAGTNLPYLSVPESLTAQDDFFTPLTLPLASFDLLKSVYVAPAPLTPPVDAAQVVSAPAPEVPAAPDASISLGALPEVTPEAPIAPPEVAPATPTPETVPVAPTPEVQIAPVIVEQTPPVDPQPVVSNVATINPTPEVPAAPAQSSVDLTLLKENFMKSCENMFDGLVSKLTE